MTEDRLREYYDILSEDEKQELADGGCPDRVGTLYTDEVTALIHLSRMEHQRSRRG